VIETAPGEEAQVDYGTGPMVRDPLSGKYRRTRLFVMTLGYSRKSVRLLVFRSSSQVWAELHEKAFRRLTGVTRVVVLDNLREGVLTPEHLRSHAQSLYRDVLQHYGAVSSTLPRRAPRSKGESRVRRRPCAENSVEGTSFRRAGESPDLPGPVGSALGRHAHPRHYQAAVAVMFAEEKPTLLPLPVEPFRYYQYGERTVHLDGCVEVEAAYYGAPPGWIGRRVQVQWMPGR